MSLGFKESIIIPLHIYKQCEEFINIKHLQGISAPKTIHQTVKSKDLLYSTDLPADLKMKLYNQQVKFETSIPASKSVTAEDSEIDRMKKDIPAVLNHISSRKRPYVQNILEKFIDKPSIISWNKNLEVTVDGSFLSGSNLIDILQCLVGEKIISKSEDIPLGLKNILAQFDALGIPKTWVFLSGTTFRAVKTPRPPRGTKKKLYAPLSPHKHSSSTDSGSDTAVEASGWANL